MKRKYKYLLISTLLISVITVFALSEGNDSWGSNILNSQQWADGTPSPEPQPAPDPAPQQTAQTNTPQDSSVRYAVQKTQITEYDDLDKTYPIDLRTPSNIKNEVEYDSETKTYLFRTKVGDGDWVTTLTMTPKEYNNYLVNKSMASFFKTKYDKEREKGDDKGDFSLKDVKVNLGTAERFFGPGGVRIKTNGYTELSMGVKNTITENPTISPQYRNRTMFDFDQKIEMNVKASVGDKINFDMNYNTESTFDFDSKKLKLAYEGKEDEILKRLEAGNVSMATTNSLINGGAALFGIRADLQFGKLKISTVVSQQESQSQTVSSKGGVQTMPFEFTADQYDENKHFFLGHYFQANYDTAMSSLPSIKSPIIIERLEVWITNKRNNFDQARDIVAFADLAETNTIGNPSLWAATPGAKYPSNGGNNLYSTIKGSYPQVRNINLVSATFDAAGLVSGQDYEKVEKARLLTANEYTFNPKTGYISLKYELRSDEVLAVSYEYKAGGNVYKVGELSADVPTKEEAGNPNAGALFVKLLKPVNLSPNSYTWRLMMKNIYSLGIYQLQKDRFRLNIAYQNDTTGTYVNYISEGNIKATQLLKVMRLDRLDSRGNPLPNGGGDGIFDYVEDLTVNSNNGQIIFPVTEPFGRHLGKMIGDPEIAQKYMYTELYDTTLTVARQAAEKNKFKMSGQYRASSNTQISLNATNVAHGSVIVTAAGERLIENQHYTVDYISGTVTITDDSKAMSDIRVTLENQAMFSMQKKTLMGLNLSYDFSKNFTIGGTIMHMYEKPLTTKTNIGDESLQNTLWGLNTSFQTQSQWLTNLVDKLPFYNATAPSQIAFSGEFAQMIPGHYENKYSGGFSYLDDFETAKSSIKVEEPRSWVLASTPANRPKGNNALFPEALLSDSIEYGKNRAHIAWFKVDQSTFLRNNNSLTPPHLKGDKDQLSNHFVREVQQGEIYPNRDILYNETATISPLNISYYPSERGAFNINASEIDLNTGQLKKPEKRWGGIMRRLDTKDFEASNIEYIEFWLMDPYVYDRDSGDVHLNKQGGDLYFNLGEISEDILKDGKKFYENGLPIDKDPSLYNENNWGRTPSRPSVNYSFAGEAGRTMQDVGYDGLSTNEEMEHPSYKTFRDFLLNNLTPAVRSSWIDDPFSPLNDPAGDNYHYYRGNDYDEQKTSILNRYKRYNGSEGNSTTDDKSAERGTPDVEDTNSDHTMSETESYYQYKINLRPNALNISDTTYIVDKRSIEVSLANGKRDSITWYQFKIPIRDGESINKISDFRSIRFMRMFMHGFSYNTFLRFATLDLVRGDWRVYTNNLQDNNAAPSNGKVSSTTVNIEENGDKQPVNYIMPPGVSRIVDPSQPQIKQENEQSMSIKVEDLGQNDSRAIYKNTNYDLRRFKRLQMFAHAEDILGANTTALAKNDLAVFIRLGSDYKNNYYEYEIPLVVTPEGRYSPNSNLDKERVWPKENMFDFPLELLKDIKLKRNKEKRQGVKDVSYTTVFDEYDPEKPGNRVSVLGNPALSEIKVLMIGVRNKSSEVKSGEVWVNELRLTDFDEEGGWAAQGNMNIVLSDLATINLSGRKETIGFGALDQGLMERRSDDLLSYSLATTIDLGKLLPEKTQASIPLYYAYSNQATTPKYDPLDQDVTIKESLDLVDTKAEKDSILNLSQDKTITKSISVNNARLNIRSKTPMPYDPANFNISYSYNETEISNPTTKYDRIEDYRLNLGYSYSPVVKPWEPFKNSKSKAPMSKFTKALSFNYLPNSITFQNTLSRHYGETMLRDLESFAIGAENSKNESLTFDSEFYWDRNFSLAWDFTRNLRFSFESGTKAEIEEPWLQVNKDLNRQDYDIWRDSVIHSLKNLGTPYSYRQAAKLTYNVPFSTIPIMDWVNTTANYDANYNWDRGAQTGIENLEVGNNISNTATFTLNNRLNMLSLYNKWGFLKKVNQKFDGGSLRRATTGKGKDVAKKKYEQNLTLIVDSVMIVKHNLNNKNIKLTARRNSDGRIHPVKYKKVDNNSIKLTDIKDTTSLKLTIVQGPDPEESTWYRVAQYSARGLMSLRSLSINYSKRNENYIYGFRPMIGDAFGQTNNTDYGLSPGLGFAFGLDGGEDYVKKLYSQNLLVGNTDFDVTPATFSEAIRLDVKAELEPIKGLKISLTALHEDNRNTELLYMYEGMPRNLGGSFAMTTVALSSALRAGDAADGYSSKVFDNFLAYRKQIADRLDAQYANLPMGSSLKKININSSDVLIPAFLAAYTGKDVNNTKLSAFPAMMSMLPNWTMSYDGILGLIPALKKQFKNIRINHAYSCQYRVGAYTSYSDWTQVSGDLGFVKDPLYTGTDGNNPLLPSSPYSISSVSLTEAFNPLFGAEGTLNNSMTIRSRFNNSRTINLNIASYQIVETFRNEFVVGLGYKITNFNRVLGMKNASTKGFSNDLNIMGDVSYSKNQSLIRRIEEGYSQATAGSTAFNIKLSADYSLSKALSLKAFFDRVVNSPLMSASGYPTTISNFGISLRFTLTQ